jgi:hypothetical protein
MKPKLLDCGHPPLPDAYSYGITSKGQKICFDCCLVRDLERLKTNSRILVYWSDNDTITNWPGGHLGRIVSSHKIRNTWVDRSYASPTMLAVSVIDVHGQRWYGRGLGEGLYLKLRKHKNQQ